MPEFQGKGIAQKAIRLCEEKHRNGNWELDTIGRINTKDRVSFTYGYLESRIKMQDWRGFLPAFWMMGNEADWTIDPDTGKLTVAEIDIMEHLGGEPTVYGSMHRTVGDDDNVISISSANEQHLVSFIPDYRADEWHNYAILWTTDSIIWYVDSTEILAIDLNEPGMEKFQEPMYILLNLAVGGDWPGNPSEDTVFPVDMQVDYVRVYQKR